MEIKNWFSNYLKKIKISIFLVWLLCLQKSTSRLKLILTDWKYIGLNLYAMIPYLKHGTAILLNKGIQNYCLIPCNKTNETSITGVTVRGLNVYCNEYKPPINKWSNNTLLTLLKSSIILENFNSHNILWCVYLCIWQCRLIRWNMKEWILAQDSYLLQDLKGPYTL